MEKHAMLENHFGYTEFRPGQAELIDALLAGHDILGIMPTGAGKSMCYQLPALMLPSVTLVVSPLIALMHDQVMALKRRGIPAAYINSSLTAGQCAEAMRRAARGMYRIIYIAPERLSMPGFIELARRMDVSLLVVDEAHCISHWGKDFRPSYLSIADFVELLPQRPRLGAFTATATPQVRRDIIDALRLREPHILTTGFDRPNLYFDVRRPQDKYVELAKHVAAHPNQSGIVYCTSRANVVEVCSRLRDAGCHVTYYHGGLSGEERAHNQERFISGQDSIMVATNAFGMGIDKPDVRYVVHYNMPRDMDAYYQEAGRAGRDGRPAECVLYYSHSDYLSGMWMIDNATENPNLTPEQCELAYNESVRRLNQMRGYCTTRRCLRATLLEYFGECLEQRCGNCSNCRSTPAWLLETALDAIVRVQSAPGSALLKELISLRDVLCEALNLTPARTFTDAELAILAVLHPCDMASLRDIHNINAESVEHYGGMCVNVIRVKCCMDTPAHIDIGAVAWSEAEETLLHYELEQRAALARIAQHHGRLKQSIQTHIRLLEKRRLKDAAN